MPGMSEGPHKERLLEAIAVEADGQRALLAGDAEGARVAFAAAADGYRASWELASPTAYGRLVGLLKATILSGEDATGAARYVREQVPEPGDSPVAGYALAVASIVLGEAPDTAAMRTAAAPFVRAADALDALGAGDAAAYAEALRAIVADFEAREAHLSGVAIADTALMLERLAEPRGLAVRPASPLLP